MSGFLRALERVLLAAVLTIANVTSIGLAGILHGTPLHHGRPEHSRRRLITHVSRRPTLMSNSHAGPPFSALRAPVT